MYDLMASIDSVYGVYFNISDDSTHLRKHYNTEPDETPILLFDASCNIWREGKIIGRLASCHGAWIAESNDGDISVSVEDSSGHWKNIYLCEAAFCRAWLAKNPQS